MASEPGFLDVIVVVIVAVGLSALTFLTLRGDSRAPGLRRSFVRLILPPILFALCLYKVSIVAAAVGKLEYAVGAYPESPVSKWSQPIQVLASAVTVPNLLSIFFVMAAIAYAVELLPLFASWKARRGGVDVMSANS